MINAINASTVGDTFQTPLNEIGIPYTYDQYRDILRTKEEKLSKDLDDIEIIIKRLGYTIHHPRGGTNSNTTDSKKITSISTTTTLKSGININGKLSFRGVAKAVDYFHRLDEDRDGLVSFADIRAMESISTSKSFLHSEEYLNLESLKMLINDDGVSNVKLDDMGRLDVDGFVRYRSSIEIHRPLEKELNAMGMSCLPVELQLWSQVKIMIDEVKTHRQNMLKQEELLMSIGQPSVDVLLQPTDPLTIDDCMYILTLSNVIYDKAGYVRCMVDRIAKQKILESLDKRFIRKDLSRNTEKYSDMIGQGIIINKNEPITSAEMKVATPVQFLSWVFSNRPLPACSSYIQVFLRFRYGIFKSVRELDEFCKICYAVSLHLRLRLVFRSFKPLAISHNKGVERKLVVEALIGSGDVTDEGFGCSWSLSAIPRVDEHLKRLKLPRDCGTAFIFDFMIRDGVDEATLEKTTDMLRIFLLNNFIDELKKSLQWRGLFVTTAINESDGALILRVAITYRKIFSIDWLMSNLMIPYSINELIKCNGTISTSMQLTDLFNAPNVSLDTQLSVRANISIAFMRDVVLQLLERLWLATSSAVTADELYDSEDRNKHRVDADDVKETLMDRYRKLQKLRVYYPIISKYSRMAYNYLAGIEGTNITVKHKKVSQLLTHLGLTNVWIKQNVPPSVASTIGMFTSMYEKKLKAATAYMKSMFNSIKQYVHLQYEKEEEQRRRRFMSVKKKQGGEDAKTEEEKAKEDMIEKMKRMGIEVEDDAFMTEDESPIGYYRQVQEEMNSRYHSNMALYEKMYEACLGLHHIQVICGNTQLNISMQGCDFFDLLPSPQPIEQLKRHYEELKKKIQL